MSLFKSITMPITALFKALIPLRFSTGSTQIVPQTYVAGRALTAVIAIMSFLACLTAGAVYMVNQSANAWFRDIASEVTVQISPIAERPMRKRLADVTLFLSRQSGVVRVRPLTVGESNELLEPWLGKSSAFDALPVPRLVALELDRQNPANLQTIGKKLSRQFPKVILDDHRHWQAQIRTVTRSVALGGIILLLLVAAATIAIVVSATRSAMASNRDIIEVLHFVGAKKRFISHEFEQHFLVIGIRSGVIGAVFAMFAFWLMPILMQYLGGQSVTVAELKRFVGSATLDFNGHMTLLGIVLGVSAICMFTSRYWVSVILNSNEAQTTHVQRQTNFPSTAKSRKPSVEPTHKNRGVMHIGFGWISRIAMVFAALLFLGFGYFISTIEKSKKLPNESADGIAVLTGGKSRISESIRLLAAGKGRRLLISGVNEKTGQNELIKLSPTSEPLFDCCIDLGRKATNTLGNAEEIRNWVQDKKFRSLILVTSNYHMPRAMAEARHYMPKTKIIPYAVLPDTYKKGTWWRDGMALFILGKEYLKMYRTRIRAYLFPVRI